jgi:hypothetical protein
MVIAQLNSRSAGQTVTHPFHVIPRRGRRYEIRARWRTQRCSASTRLAYAGDGLTAARRSVDDQAARQVREGRTFDDETLDFAGLQLRAAPTDDYAALSGRAVSDLPF